MVIKISRYSKIVPTLTIALLFLGLVSARADAMPATYNNTPRLYQINVAPTTITLRYTIYGSSQTLPKPSTTLTFPVATRSSFQSGSPEWLNYTQIGARCDWLRSSDVGKGPFSCTRTLYITGLPSNTNYVVDASDGFVGVRTSWLPSPPTALFQTSKSATAVDVSWSGAEGDGATIDLYRVRWYGIGQDTPPENTITTSGTFATITNLSPGTDYNVEVFAHTEVGWSLSWKHRVARTSEIPQYIEYIRTSTCETFTELCFSASAWGDGIPIDNFKIEWSREGTNWVTQESANGLFVIPQLTENTLYQVRIYAHSDAGWSLPRSTLMDTWAYSTFVPLPPRNVKATMISTDQASVRWSAPLGINSKAPVNKYRLEWSLDGGSWQSKEVTQLSSLVSGLTPASSYSFRVTAHTVGGWGEPSSVVQLQVAATYTVTFKYDSATSGNSVPAASFTTGGTEITLPSPIRTGYTFAGWFSNPGLTSKIGDAGTNYSPSGAVLELDVYAKWIKNPIRAVATIKPTVAGIAKITKSLSANNSVWTGYPSPSITYQWYACNSAIFEARSTLPVNCIKINGATQRTFKVAKVQKGKFISVLVTGSSAGTTKTTWLSKSTKKVE